MSAPYNFEKIKELLCSFDNVTCEHLERKQITPDKAFIFYGPGNIFTPPIMVCYEKNKIKFDCGIIYSEEVKLIEKFLQKIFKREYIDQLHAHIIKLK